MKKLTFIAILFFIISCQQDKGNVENGQNDPQKLVAKYDAQQNRAFRKKNSSYPTDTFDIDPRKDTLLISQQGTLLEIPKNNFLDDKGEVITSPIRIEWQDILTLEQAMNYGLSTVDAEGNILETGGMVYWDVSNENTKNVQLKAPIRIEVQSSLAQPQLQQYEGQWKGDNLVWAEPKALEKTMSLIDLDALYGEESQSLQQGYYNFHNKGNTPPKKILIQVAPPMIDANCPVNNLWISLLENTESKQEFQYTWLATQEFYARYKCLIKACSVEGLELYIKSHNLPLWKVDTKVAELLEKENNVQASNFRKFAALKQTIVRNTKPYSAALIKKIRSNLKKNNASIGFFSLPIFVPASKTGFINIGFVIADMINPMRGNELEASHWNVQIKNRPIGKDIDVFCLLNKGRGLQKFYQKDNKYTLDAYLVPQNQKALFIAKSKDNKHIGWQEVVITDALVETEITIKSIKQQGNYKAILKAYMNPDAQHLFTEQQEGDCCKGYYPD